LGKSLTDIIAFDRLTGMKKTEIKNKKSASRTGLKQCRRCRKWKDPGSFYRRSGSKDGLEYLCRDCILERMRINYAAKVRHRHRKYRRQEEYHRVVGGVKEKRCVKCKKWKPESEFYRLSSSRDGHAVLCKSCANQMTNDARRRRTMRRRGCFEAP